VGGYIECPVYDRYALRPEMRFRGPALIEERESTSVIGPGDEFLVDDEHNVVVQLADFEAVQ
jgi:N-methylhydantoinase A